MTDLLDDNPFTDDPQPAKTKKRPIKREHTRQKHGRLFTRDAITAKHKFFAFDRSKAAGQFTHLIERARGIQKSTPDTMLRVKGMMPIWCEWKDTGKKPDADQLQILEELRELGDFAEWFDSVVDYASWLHEIGVPMRPHWLVFAQDHDLRATASIQRREIKNGQLPKKPSKPRAVKPTQGRLKRIAALRSRVMF
jgi:hypothetical protein